MMKKSLSMMQRGQMYRFLIQSQLAKCAFVFSLFLLAGLSAAAQKNVSGKLLDETGSPMIGVTVLVKGTTTAAVTDIDGNYKITVPTGSDVLVFSFVGYDGQEIAVGDRSSVDLTLQPGKSLEEVVVVGYGTQRKVDLTGAVASISSKDFENRPVTSPDQILGGRVAGIHIANRSGDPGAPIDVRIRGVGTVGNNQPLWVIDGVPIVQTSNITVNTASFTESNPLAGINPSDIETIDVLKDASAAAIYGARAANGVVIVTTKRGKAGKMTATYDGYVGTQTVPNSRRISVLDPTQYIALQKEIGNDLSAFAGKPNFDWQDAIFKTGTARNHNLTVSGGTDKMNFNIGAGYHGQDGVELGQDFQRLSLKANSDIKVGKYFKFGESALLTASNRLVQSEGGNFAAFNSARNAPYYQPYESAGVYAASSGATRGSGANATNYLWATDIKNNETRVKSNKMLANVYGEFEPIAGLKYKFSLGADYNVGDGFFFQEATGVDYGGGTRGSLLVQERPIELTTNMTNTLTYNVALGKSNITALVGYEETNFRYDKVRLQGRDLFNTNIRFAAVSNSVAGANEADIWALRGTLARLNYVFDNKYLLTASVRKDESSRFGPENRSGIFPSLSVGWRLTEEAFLKNSNLFNNLKLRGSWGQSGNQFTGSNFAYLSRLAINSFYVLGDAQKVVRAPAPIIFANSGVKWETSTQTDFGIDATLLNNRLDVTFDLYQKLSQDLLLSLPLPYSSGYFLPADANIGSISNNGIELAVNYRDRVAADITYSIGGNITTVNNKVVSLGGIPSITSGTGGSQTHRTTEGESLAYFYGFKTAGIYQTDAEAAEGAKKDAFSGGAKAGDIKFADVNGDGTIDAKDRTKLGTSIPGYYYGANFSIGFKGLDISALFQGVGDVQVFNAARAGLESMNGGSNQSATVLNRWSPSNTSGTIPRATGSDLNANNRYSDRWIEDASYLRFKNLQIGYRLPTAAIAKATRDFIGGSRVYFGVQNLYTFTKYKGFDPEVTRGASFQKGEFALANGVDSGGSPQPMIMQLGWQVTFQ
jgi:TonB-dependent starch-binding outer membrane protein SusC